MNLFIFLGNIGGKYASTRHNIGFLFGDYLEQKWQFPEWQVQPKFFGEVAEGIHSEQKIVFLKPHTLMNRSGKSALAVKNFYKIAPERILLVYDDKDLPFGTVRFREKGSSGGHKGVADCLRVLGTEEVPRLKLGTDIPERRNFRDTADFVLAKFSPEEISELPGVFEQSAEKIEELLRTK